MATSLEYSIYLHLKTSINSQPPDQLTLPTIDLQGISDDPIRRKEVIGKVKDAFESWGFFQIVNHGIPAKCFGGDVKRGDGFSRARDGGEEAVVHQRPDRKSRVVYNSNFDLYAAPVTNWRESYCTMAPNPPQPHELPQP
ncbi:hypothetical protein SSX86_021641 [Deinandra increscens subsp. villosa]|uniref:Non-haem dioxygenase N-terminal domain-containing protein n=1 Tax=Deinandra increscens subsp. villosa TaxID=3103831 RepID=A0AAP0GSK1_9ASTR